MLQEVIQFCDGYSTLMTFYTQTNLKAVLLKESPLPSAVVSAWESLKTRSNLLAIGFFFLNKKISPGKCGFPSEAFQYSED